MQTDTCNPYVGTHGRRFRVYLNPMSTNVDTVEVLTSYLNVNGLQQNELAERLGVDPKTVNRWVNRHTNLTERKLRRVFKQLHVDGEEYGLPDPVPSPDVLPDDMAEVKARLAAIMFKMGLPDDEWRKHA